MQLLYRILVKNHYLIYFLLLVCISFFILINKNVYFQSSYFNSSNYVIGNLFEFKTSITDYFLLKELNNKMLIENNALKKRLLELKEIEKNIKKSNFIIHNKFDLIPAKIINNSVSNQNNYFTLNKGYNDNIRVGLGVIGSFGVVGKINSVSANFSRGSSLLNSRLMIPALLGAVNTICTEKWISRDPETINIMYIPKHINVIIGDTVFTSSFNSVFPSRIPIAVVKNINESINSNFLEIIANLIEDFYSISYVYVIKDKLAKEKKLIELKNEK